MHAQSLLFSLPYPRIPGSIQPLPCHPLSSPTTAPPPVSTTLPTTFPTTSPPPPQGVWIRARTVDGTRATLFLTEAFAYTSTYARILGRDRLPLPCEPRTAWMCPLVHYDTYRVIVSIHQLQPGQR